METQPDEKPAGTKRATRRKKVNASAAPGINVSAADESAPAFSWAQQVRLLSLRAQYARGHDVFAENERAHLRFLRWLIDTARLTP